MAQRRGEVGTAQGARILEVNQETLRRWAQAYLAGETTRIRYARRDTVGRYWFERIELLELRARAESGELEAPPPPSSPPRQSRQPQHR